ncbi:MAG TPA: hypothetical protein VMW15_01695, partial [Terracidiphilus sp.]|nr:hypothetical protein [Terracidiphilus sp.]
MKYPAQGCKFNSAAIVKINAPGNDAGGSFNISDILQYNILINWFPLQLGARKEMDIPIDIGVFI